MTVRSRMFAGALVASVLAAGCGSDETTSTLDAAPAASTVSTVGDDAVTTTVATTEATAAPTTEATVAPTTSAPSADGASGSGGVSSSDLSPRELLRAASERTQASPSHRFDADMEIIGAADVPGGAAISMTMSGSFAENGDLEMSLDLSRMAELMAQDPEVGPMASVMFEDPIQIRQIGATSYVAMPFIGALMGSDATWFASPVEEADQLGDLPFATGSDPTEMLAAIGGADVEELGREEIRGVDTTHYRGVIDPTAADAAGRAGLDSTLGEMDLEGFEGTLPTELWIDDDGYVRRMVMRVEENSTEDFDSMTMDFHFFDFGADIAIEVPDADDVMDMSELGG